MDGVPKGGGRGRSAWGWIPLEEVCRRHHLSVGKFLAWGKGHRPVWPAGSAYHAISDLPPDRSAQEWLTMALRCSPTRHLAVSLLGECGIAAIWRLNVAAAEAYRTGYPAAASAMLEIAEAAEEAWFRAQGDQALDR